MIDAGSPVSDEEGNELTGEIPDSGSIIKKWVDQTRYGIIFFAAGIGIIWIPYVKYFGLLLFPAGLAGMILGRKAFDGRQGKYLAASVIIFVFSQILLPDVETNMSYAIANSAPIASSVLPTIRDYFIAILAISYVGSISFVLPAWRLSRGLEKGLFVLALVAGIVITSVIYTLLFPELSISISSFLGTHNVSQLNSTLPYFQSLSLLNASWYLIMVVAYWLVYDDVTKGIIQPVNRIPE